MLQELFFRDTNIRMTTPKKKKSKRNEIDSFKNLDDLLSNGCKLHAFRSGGGLRVVTIEGEKKGYGEHPHLSEAIQHAVEDYLTGGRPYSKVYGKIHDHYLTGAYPKNDGIVTTVDILDRHVFRGLPLDAFCKNGKIVVQLSNPYLRQGTPKEIINMAQSGKRVVWERNGQKYTTEPYTFPNGDLGSSTFPGGDSVNLIKEGTSETFLQSALYAIEHEGEIKEHSKILFIDGKRVTV